MNQDSHIVLDKELRRDIDAIIQRLRFASVPRTQPRPTIAELEKILEDTGQSSLDILPNGQLATSIRMSRERSLALTKLQEAVMWLGMDLKAINDEAPGTVENPYPNSKDPSNTVIDPTADGLKL